MALYGRKINGKPTGGCGSLEIPAVNADGGCNKHEAMRNHGVSFFLTRKMQPPLWKEMNKFRRYFTMLKNVIKGFEEMMNCVLTAMNESLSDPYAGWNEGEELLMLNEVRCGIR